MKNDGKHGYWRRIGGVLEVSVTKNEPLYPAVWAAAQATRNSSEEATLLLKKLDPESGFRTHVVNNCFVASTGAMKLCSGILFSNTVTATYDMAPGLTVTRQLNAEALQQCNILTINKKTVYLCDKDQWDKEWETWPSKEMLPTLPARFFEVVPVGASSSSSASSSSFSTTSTSLTTSAAVTGRTSSKTSVAGDNTCDNTFICCHPP